MAVFCILHADKLDINSSYISSARIETRICVKNGSHNKIEIESYYVEVFAVTDV